jgi:hypothetical protein
MQRANVLHIGSEIKIVDDICDLSACGIARWKQINFIEFFRDALFVWIQMKSKCT